jgi:hypothetical protein
MGFFSLTTEPERAHLNDSSLQESVQKVEGRKEKEEKQTQKKKTKQNKKDQRA